MLIKMHVQLFAKIAPTTEVCGCISTLIMGWLSSLFDPQEAFLLTCRQESLPWPQEWAPYLFSRAQVLPPVLSSECLGEYRAWILLRFTTPAQEPIMSLPHYQAREVTIAMNKSIIKTSSSVSMIWIARSTFLSCFAEFNTPHKCSTTRSASTWRMLMLLTLMTWVN